MANLIGKSLFWMTRMAGFKRTFGNLASLKLFATRFQRTEAIQKIFCKQLNRPVFIRSRTSDLDVFLKIMLQKEYDVPLSFKPRVIIDGGANIGVSSLFFANRYPEAQIYSVEPDPTNFKILSLNCGGQPRIIATQAALWSHSATLTQIDPRAEKWATSYREAGPGEVPTKGMSINDLREKFGFDIIDILKLDIEGAERQLFETDCSQWLGNVRVIMIELHDRTVPGSSEAFYRQIGKFHFNQEISGENIVITILHSPK